MSCIVVCMEGHSKAGLRLPIWMAGTSLTCAPLSPAGADKGCWLPVAYTTCGGDCAGRHGSPKKAQHGLLAAAASLTCSRCRCREGKWWTHKQLAAHRGSRTTECRVCIRTRLRGGAAAVDKRRCADGASGGGAQTVSTIDGPAIAGAVANGRERFIPIHLMPMLPAGGRQ